MTFLVFSYVFKMKIENIYGIFVKIIIF